MVSINFIPIYYGTWLDVVLLKGKEAENPGNLTDIEREAGAVNRFVSGWFGYDHDHPNGEAFIESNEHPIRPSTIESAPDVSTLLQAVSPPAFESEMLIFRSGVASGLFRHIIRFGGGEKQDTERALSFRF